MTGATSSLTEIRFPPVGRHCAYHKEISVDLTVEFQSLVDLMTRAQDVCSRLAKTRHKRMIRRYKDILKYGASDVGRGDREREHSLCISLGTLVVISKITVHG